VSYSPNSGLNSQLNSFNHLQFGEKLADIQNSGGSVTATFESGLKATGSLIIGTDGPQSTVRKLLLGEEKAQAKKIPVVLYNMNVCYKDASKALQVRRLHEMNTVALQPEKALSLWTSSELHNLHVKSALTPTSPGRPRPRRS
jgi:2-polyprenyl-6-methoxyphenol hydroxylase-like FAD-dependent oxidoreductase